MEERMQIIQAAGNSKIQIGVIPGHYATNHSHINYYVDITSLKTGYSGADVNVVTPELNAVNQMIFRDNTQKKIWGKQVLLLIASVSTGKSINRAMDCLKYYNGNLVGIASIFSAIKENNGTAIHALFTEKDLPDYMTYTSSECPMCKSGQKVDALVNSFGYSKI